MKKLSFKELERIVNEEGVELIERWNGGEEITSTTFGNLMVCVRNKIDEVLDRYGISHSELHTTDYRGKVYLMNYYDNWTNKGPTGIEVKVKKVKDKEKSNWTNTYYSFKNIEIEEKEVCRPRTSEIMKLETVEDYINYKNECREVVKKKKKKKIDDFVENLDGLEFEKFIKLYKEFKDLDYTDRKNICKKFGIEDRFMYL